jgi:hypothetical protein
LVQNEKRRSRKEQTNKQQSKTNKTTIIRFLRVAKGDAEKSGVGVGDEECRRDACVWGPVEKRGKPHNIAASSLSMLAAAGGERKTDGDPSDRVRTSEKNVDDGKVAGGGEEEEEERDEPHFVFALCTFLPFE